MSSLSDIPSSVEQTPAYKFGDISRSIFKGVKAATKKGKEERLQSVPYSSSKYVFGDFTRGVVTSAITGLSSSASSSASSSTATEPLTLNDAVAHGVPQVADVAGGGGGGGDDVGNDEGDDDQEVRDLQEAIRRSQLDCVIPSNGVHASASARASAPPVARMNDIDLARPPPRAQPAQLPIPQSIPSSSSSSLVEGANESSPSPSLCAVCLDQPKTMAFHPCGHMCLCTGTFNRLVLFNTLLTLTLNQYSIKQVIVYLYTNEVQTNTV